MFEPLDRQRPAGEAFNPQLAQRPPLAALQVFPHLGCADQYQDEIFELIDRIWLFEDLRRPEIAALCARMDCHAASRGQEILKEGDDGDFLVIILTGEVAVIKHTDGHHKLIATVGPGAVLGEMSLVDGIPRFASCIASEPTDFAVLTRDTLYDLMVSEPALGGKVLLLLLQLLTRRLRDTSEKLMPFIAGLPV